MQPRKSNRKKAAARARKRLLFTPESRKGRAQDKQRFELYANELM